jgi:hypothetical protein
MLQHRLLYCIFVPDLVPRRLCDGVKRESGENPEQIRCCKLQVWLQPSTATPREAGRTAERKPERARKPALSLPDGVIAVAEFYQAFGN